jgi:hypothetical protein
MALELTFCRRCTGQRPDFRRAVTRMCARYGAALELTELDCMAACDDDPAVMLGFDYHPRLTVDELEARIAAELQPVDAH